MLGSPNWSRPMELSAKTRAEKLALARAMFVPPPRGCGSGDYPRYQKGPTAVVEERSTLDSEELCETRIGNDPH